MTYLEKLLSIGYVPQSEREEQDQELALQAFEFALRKRREAQDEILKALQS